MKRFFICPLILASLVGCRSNTSDNVLVPVTVTGTVSSTKVDLDGLSPVWVKGEQVAFFTSFLELCPPFTVDEGGSSTATFSGEKPSGSSVAYALYPYNANSSYSKSGIVSYLPSKQDGSFANAVMVACGDESSGFSFKNICCVIRLNIPSSLNIVKVEIYRDDRVSGSFAVDPVTEPVSFNNSEPSSIAEQRAFVVSDDVLSGEVYISVLPSEDRNINLAFTDTEGRVALVSTSLPSGNPYLSGTLKDFGTVSSLTFGDAASIADATQVQL